MTFQTVKLSCTQKAKEGGKVSCKEEVTYVLYGERMAVTCTEKACSVLYRGGQRLAAGCAAKPNSVLYSKKMANSVRNGEGLQSATQKRQFAVQRDRERQAM